MVIILVLGHPWLLGLWGRVGEQTFQHDLRIGMPRSEVLALARRSGGRAYVPTPSYSIESGAPGQLRVSFVDSFTLCIENGKEYQLLFNERWMLTGWEASDWGNAC
jgi:hypothetical protein